MPSTHFRKTTQRKKMNSQEGSITSKGRNDEKENDSVSGKEILIKHLIINKRRKLQK